MPDDGCRQSERHPFGFLRVDGPRVAFFGEPFLRVSVRAAFFDRLLGFCFGRGTLFRSLASFFRSRSLLLCDRSACTGRSTRRRCGLAEGAPVDILLRLQTGGKRDPGEKAAVAVLDILWIIGRLPPWSRSRLLAGIPQRQGLGVRCRFHLVAE